MSNIVEFRKVLSASDLTNGIAVLDGETAVNPVMQLPNNNQSKMQVCAITISDRIPNVYNAYPLYDFDNTTLIVSFWNGAWNDITVALPRGLYPNTDSIQAAIGSALKTYWIGLDPANTGIIIETNTVTDQIIITLDDSKLNPLLLFTKFRVDMSRNVAKTDMGSTLGFSDASFPLDSSIVSPVFTCDLIPKMDTQGTTCDVQCSLVSLRRRNNEQVRTLALVPFAGKNTLSDNIWPSSGLVSPVMVYEGTKSVSYMRINIRTLEGRPMLFMGGSVHVVVSFIY